MSNSFMSLVIHNKSSFTVAFYAVLKVPEVVLYSMQYINLPTKHVTTCKIFCRTQIHKNTYVCTYVQYTTEIFTLYWNRLDMNNISFYFENSPGAAAAFQWCDLGGCQTDPEPRPIRHHLHCSLRSPVHRLPGPPAKHHLPDWDGPTDCWA